MDRISRIYVLHRFLSGLRYPVSLKEIVRELKWSTSMVRRVIKEMVGTMDAPIEYDRATNGYRYTRKGYELPGLWFTPGELFALVASHQLLTEIQPGLLGPLLKPLTQRIETILADQRLGGQGALGRVRLPGLAKRAVDDEHFQAVASALLQRMRIEILYHGRGKDRKTVRRISPQRLVRYRDNWYLDSFCHKTDQLKTFALDRIKIVRPLDRKAIDLPDELLDAQLTRGYGIFSGPVRDRAVLRFDTEATRWVADETWHPDQQARLLPDGRLELTVPYSDPRELLMDVLRHVPHVEVLAPADLQADFTQRLAQGLLRQSEAEDHR